MASQVLAWLAFAAAAACPTPEALSFPEAGVDAVPPEQVRMTTRQDDLLDPSAVLDESVCREFGRIEGGQWPRGERTWLMLDASDLADGESWGLRLPAAGFRDFCVFWPRDAGSWRTRCSGSPPGSAERRVHQSPDFIAPADLDPDRPVLITARSPFRSVFPIHIGSADTLVQGSTRSLLATGAVYGTLAALVAYGLLMLGTVRNLGLLFFSAYVGLFASGLFIAENLHARWLGWSWTGLTLHGPYLLLGAAFIAGTLFLRHFLRRDGRASWTEAGLWALGLSGGGLMLLASVHAAWALPASEAGALVFASGALALSVVGVRRGQRNAGPLLLGFVFLLLALLINSFIRLGWVPNPGFGSIDLLKLGLLAGGLSLGFAIQREFSAMRRERDRASLLADTHERIARYRAEFDTTTGLPTRRRFFKLVSERVAAAGDQGLGLLMVHLDEFRRLRHLGGQERSEDMLRELCRRLQPLESGDRVLGQTDSDEFSMLFPLPREQRTAESLMDALAGEIRTRLAEPLASGEEGHQLSTSIGGSLFPHIANGGDALLLQAEAAVFEAREAGGDRFCLYGRSDGPDIMERWKMRDRLAEAIRNDALAVHYQPIIDLASGNIRQLEALARWNDPELGNVPASVFIEVAEAFDLIDDLGRGIMSHACHQLGEWRRRGLATDTGLSLNLSTLQLRNDGFESWFLGMLADTGLAPSDIHLEVTETVLVENLALARHQLGRLARQGVGISVDDFGVGYSSLSYIRELPIDILKIDRSFIARLDQALAEREIVRSILGMARKLRLTVVAEGIESEGEAAFLRRHHCDLGQGFLFGRPMGPDRMTERLAAEPRQPVTTRQTGDSGGE